VDAVSTAKILAAADELVKARVARALEEAREQIRLEILAEVRESNHAILEQVAGIDALQGERGDVGPQGLKGDRGDAGPQGPQGPRGQKGETGPVGPQGLKGDRGEKGDAGPRGLKGDRGPDGAEGPKGDAGDRGETGPAGAPGRDGADGAPGAIGERGERGDPGPIGKTGPRGPRGEAGPRGDKGDAGAPGPVGPAGPRGDKGDQGDSPDVAPIVKSIDDKFSKLNEAVDRRISRIAFSSGIVGTSSPGSGEVKLYRLDDVDYISVKSPTNGQALVYNTTLKKWQANTVSGGGGTLSNTFTTTVETQALIPAVGNTYDIGSSTRKYRSLYLTGNTIVLGDIQLKAVDGTLQVTPQPTEDNPNPDPVPIGTGVNAADYGKITEEVSSTQDYGSL